MDKLHPQVRALRSLPTEMNLAKQPYPDDDLEQAQRQGEANVVEMPHRQAQERQAHEPYVPNASEPSQTQRSTAQRKQSAAKRKPAATSPNAFSFRQMRDGHQQPYIDELKRLEAQAERINQLLADRKRKQARTEQSVGLNHEPPAEAEKPSSKKKASKSARPSRSPRREVLPMSAHDDDTEALEAQAERIKQLLKELETALVEGEALPHDRAIACDRKSAKDHARSPTASLPAPDPSVDAPTTYRYAAETLPSAIDQNQVIVGATDPKAQQEATETAQALRSLASRELMQPAIAAPQQESRRQTARSRDRRSTSRPSIRSYGLRLRQFLQIPQTSLDRVGDAVLWIVLAAAIRVGAKCLLVPFPALAPVLLVLMFVPAAFAVYLATYVPKAGFVSIYRLFLIMLGLLLGGRF